MADEGQGSNVSGQGDVQIAWNLREKYPRLFPQQSVHRFITFPPEFAEVDLVKALANSGFFLNDKLKPQCFYCGFVVMDLALWERCDVDQMHSQNSPDCPLMNNEVDDFPLQNCFNFNFESCRLASFLLKPWPQPTISIYELAKEGFYFAGPDDNCRCHFCKLEVRQWEIGDTPHTEHLLWNKLCPLFKGYTCNTPIGAEALPNPFKPNPAIAQRKLAQIGAEKVKRNKSLEKIVIRISEKTVGVVSTKVSLHPRMSGIKERILSFEKTWPFQKLNLVQPLCKAGFFYTGKNDTCVCFHCGVHINNWNLDDCPWKEHLRLHPVCTFLKLFFDNPKEEASCCCDEAAPGSPQLDLKCRDCRQNDANVSCLPCGHICFCDICIEKHQECPACKRQSHFILKVYVS